MNEPTNLAETVAVTGGTGFVGRRIIETLLSRGIKVRALVRSADKANRVLPAESIDDGSITLCQGTLDDPDALRHLVDGCDACIHLVGIIREIRGVTFENVAIIWTQAGAEENGAYGLYPVQCERVGRSRCRSYR